jgi:glycosyltransferase involved in cell wall biosynthesis
MKKLKVLVDCRSLDLRQARGLENFAVAIIDGLASAVDHVTLDVCKPSLRAYENYFATYSNVSLVHDPIQGCVAMLSENANFGRIFSNIFHRLQRILKCDLSTRRLAWARTLKADVVYYPSHRDLPQHIHLPMVTTVHAVLPEYSESEMAVLEAHIKKASAIVTSWPHPFSDLLQRYPEITGRVFLVPYTASHLVSNSHNNEVVRRSLVIDQPYFLYASGVYPRKNHRALIEACASIKSRAGAVPIIVCTGGGDVGLQTELQRLIDKLNVSDQIRFLGHVDSVTVASLYRNCIGTVSASLWEAGSAPLHEGAAFGKPHICARIKPAEEHAKLLGAGVCFFDPTSPTDIADKLLHFTNNLDLFKKLIAPAAAVVHAVNGRYMGRCYSEIMEFAAGLERKPLWAPFLHPLGSAQF